MEKVKYMVIILNISLRFKDLSKIFFPELRRIISEISKYVTVI